MKVLVTGGAGYIGSHTTVALTENGHTPIIVDNLSNSQLSALQGIARITGSEPLFYKGSVGDTDVLSQIFAEHPNIEGVIHFAAFKAVGESIEKPLTYYQNNISNLISLLSLLQTTKVKSFVFSSSATVYGDQAPPLTEKMSRGVPTNPYGNTKLMGEMIIEDVSKQSSCAFSVLRYFNPIGAHASGCIGELPLGPPANLIPYLTQAAATLRPPLTIHGDDYDTPDGTGVRDYIHVCDLADAHIKALEHCTKSAAHYSIFNVGTGRGTSVKEVITGFKEMTGVSVPHTIGPRRSGDVASSWASTDKITSELHWSPQHSLSESLESAWKWQQSLK